MLVVRQWGCFDVLCLNCVDDVQIGDNEGGSGWCVCVCGSGGDEWL